LNLETLNLLKVSKFEALKLCLRPPQDEAKAKIGVQERKLIVFFGFIKKVKGLEYLIQAMPDIISRHPDALLMIIGDLPVNPSEINVRYYLELMSLARRLRVGQAIRFVKGFLPAEAQKYSIKVVIISHKPDPFINIGEVYRVGL